MYILIATPDAGDYKKDMETRFPEIPMYAVTSEEDIRHHVEKMDILVTIYRVADDLLKQAVNLKWIQVTTSGVKTTCSVVLPSGRI